MKEKFIMKTFEVVVGFAGYIGVENTYYVEANNENEAADLALERAREDLEVEPNEDGDSEYVVNFGGSIGGDETYYADDEDDALMQAEDDLQVLSIDGKDYTDIESCKNITAADNSGSSYENFMSDLRSKVYNALGNVAFELFHKDGWSDYMDAEQAAKAMDEAYEWFSIHFWESDDADEIYGDID